jgi:imidazolonepropionase-like amidohydrolase
MKLFAPLGEMPRSGRGGLTTKDDLEPPLGGRGQKRREYSQMSSIHIKNAKIVNEGQSFHGDLLIINELISAIGSVDPVIIPEGTKVIDATGLLLIPGVIDDQVHFI